MTNTTNRPDRDEPIAASERATETPDNFKRTPPIEEVEQDPLDSGRRLSSNQVLIGTLVVGTALGGILALIYL